MTFQLMTLPQARERFVPRSGTAFGQFIEWVMAMNTSEAPLEEIVAAGLWVVVLSAGKKIGINLATPTQIEDVGNRVDRLINVGLRLKYGDNMFEAANAFEREVLQVMERALKLGFRPGLTVSPAAWKALAAGNHEAMERELVGQTSEPTGPVVSLVQIPAALFLMDLMREAETMKTEITRLTALALKRNALSSKKADRVLVGSLSEDSARLALETLSLEYAFEADNTDHVKLVRESLKDLKRTLREQSVYSKLPFRLSDFIEEEGASIEEGWINSQLYLAAGDQPEGVILNTSTNWVQCVQGLISTPAEQTVSQFFERLSARGLKLTEEEEAWLNRELTKKVSRWQKSDHPFQVDMSGTFHLIIEIEASDVEPVDKEALLLATGGGSVEGYSAHLSSKEGDADLAAKTFSAICWEEVKAEQINEMLFVGTLSVDQVARGVTQMPEPEFGEAVKRLLLDEGLGQKGVEFLLASGRVQLTPELVAQLGQKISLARLSVCLDKWLKEATGKTDEQLAKPLVVCLCALKPRKLKAVLQDPTRRLALVRQLVSAIATPSDVMQAEIDQLDVEKIKTAVGQSWTLFILGQEVQIRQDVYRDVETAQDDDVTYQPPWDNLGDQLFSSHAQEALGLGDTPATEALLKKYPEDDVFQWLHEADPEVEAKLKAYQDLRKRYYKRFPYAKMRKLAEKE